MERVLRPTESVLPPRSLTRTTEESHASLRAVSAASGGQVTPPAASGTGGIPAPTVTAGGVVFIGATRDEKIRGFNKMTGELLWEADLPAAGSPAAGVCARAGFCSA